MALDFGLRLGASGSLLYVLLSLWAAEHYPPKVAYRMVWVGLAAHFAVDRLSMQFHVPGLFLQTLSGLLIVNRFDTNLRRARKMVNIANQDALTGCATRRVFEHYASEHIAQCAARGIPFCLAVIDCDKFKEINDTRGHAFGDEVLKLLAARLQANFKHNALVGRIGGDEFVVAAVGIEPREMERRLFQAAGKFADDTLVRGKKSSFTFGIASQLDGGVLYERYLEAADDDMYGRKVAKQMPSLFEVVA